MNVCTANRNAFQRTQPLYMLPLLQTFCVRVYHYMQGLETMLKQHLSLGYRHSGSFTISLPLPPLLYGMSSERCAVRRPESVVCAICNDNTIELM